MRFCEAPNCPNPVFGTDKISRKGYCKSHQSLREDFDRRSIIQKAMDKNKTKPQLRQQKRQIATKVRILNDHPKNIEMAEEDKVRKAEMDLWFLLVRKKLTGICQCGCGKPSSKDDDKYYKFSCCHLFPKKTFFSIRTHPNNYVERAFWGGHHTNFDEQGMDKWPKMADWEHIKELFHELAPLLTDEERANKFYSNFESLIYKN